MAARFSAIVVGASIAGLAAAIALLRRGFAVTVVEHAERGAPGGAGLALTHAALLQLHELGVSVGRVRRTRPLRGGAPAAGRRRLPAEPPDRQRAAGRRRAHCVGRGADGDERRREHGAPEPYMS